MPSQDRTVGVIGVGQMGRAVALYAARHMQCRRLVLADENERSLQEVSAWLDIHGDLGANSIERVRLDVSRADSLPASLSKADLFIVALAWPQTRRFIEITTGHEAAVASITRPAYADLNLLSGDERVSRRAVLLPMGLEPGLTEIFACALASSFQSVERLTIRCGAVPTEPIPPLGYKLLFDSKLPLRPRPAYAIEDRELRERRRFDGLEEFDVAGVGRLEAHLDGMVPWLVNEPALAHVRRLMQKTVRRPGFTHAANVLEHLGLLTPEAFDSTEANIRTQIADTSCGDVAILDYQLDGRTVHGAASRRWTLTDRSDIGTGLSSLARLTGFSAAIAAEYLITRVPRRTGWVQPQSLGNGLVDALVLGLLREGVRLDPLPR